MKGRVCSCHVNHFIIVCTTDCLYIQIVCFHVCLHACVYGRPTCPCYYPPLLIACMLTSGKCSGGDFVCCPLDQDEWVHQDCGGPHPPLLQCIHWEHAGEWVGVLCGGCVHACTYVHISVTCGHARIWNYIFLFCLSLCNVSLLHPPPSGACCLLAVHLSIKTAFVHAHVQECTKREIIFIFSLSLCNVPLIEVMHSRNTFDIIIAQSL